MKQLKNLFLSICVLTGAISNHFLLADCGSCSTQSRCCKKDCVKFEKKARAFCALLAHNLDACNVFINHAAFRNLHILGNENIDGDLIVNDQVAALEDVVINGALTIDGAPFSAAFSQYAAFVRTIPQVITNDATAASIVAFDDVQVPPTSGITNVAGVITFAETGLYLINFSATGLPLNGDFPAFGITPIPVTGTNVAGTNFATSSNSNNQVSGLILLPITVPGQQIGVRNFSSSAITITNAGTFTGGILVQPNVAAAITIVKIN